MLTVAEVAERMNRSRNTIYTWIQTGALPAVRVGNKLLVKEEALQGEPVAGPPMPELMTTGEAAVHLRCSRRTVIDMVASGDLEAFRLNANGHYRITKASVAKKLGVAA